VRVIGIGLVKVRVLKTGSISESEKKKKQTRITEGI
jgi:hypothetical protein